MTRRRQRRAAQRKRRIKRRLAPRNLTEQTASTFQAANMHDDVADRTRAMSVGGIGAIHLMVGRFRLVGRIDQNVKVLKVHRPCAESDRVRKIASSGLCGGTCLDDLELLRIADVMRHPLRY